MPDISSASQGSVAAAARRADSSVNAAADVSGQRVRVIPNDQLIAALSVDKARPGLQDEGVSEPDPAARQPENIEAAISRLRTLQHPVAKAASDVPNDQPDVGGDVAPISPPSSDSPRQVAGPASAPIDLAEMDTSVLFKLAAMVLIDAKMKEREIQRNIKLDWMHRSISEMLSSAARDVEAAKEMRTSAASGLGMAVTGSAIQVGMAGQAGKNLLKGGEQNVLQARAQSDVDHSIAQANNPALSARSQADGLAFAGARRVEATEFGNKSAAFSNQAKSLTDFSMSLSTMNNSAIQMNSASWEVEASEDRQEGAEERVKGEESQGFGDISDKSAEGANKDEDMLQDVIRQLQEKNYQALSSSLKV